MPPRNSSQLRHSELYRSDFFSATAATPCPHAHLRLTQPNGLPRDLRPRIAERRS